MLVETRYASNGDVNIAYQVLGSGPRDLVLVMGWVSHLDSYWEEPRLARFLRRLASFSRLILFDKRGTGLSDPVLPGELPDLEERMDDLRAVLDAAGSERATLLGIGGGAPTAILFAATYPERTASLLLYGGYAKRGWSPDYPWGPSNEERESLIGAIEHDWGTAISFERLAPSLVEDEDFKAWWASWLRHGASPGTALALARQSSKVDVRHILPAVHVPTLILQRSGDRESPAGGGRYLAEQIPGARYVELPGIDHLPFVGDQDAVLDEIERFLTGERLAPQPDRILTTLLLIEIAHATESAARLGDRQWAEVRQTFRRFLREEITSHRGRELSPTIDGILAGFDGPARAVRCAEAIMDGAVRLGIAVRAGLHTGEVAILGDEVAGVAIHLTAAITAMAGAGEVLVSQTVSDLLAGSDASFDRAGDLTIAGLPGSWRLSRLARGDTASTLLLAAPEPPRLTASLSRRERELAALLALGLSNKQIADELAISVATVERHVANILSKLGYRSRTQVAAWAVEQGLQEIPS
jgi:pimeloyl-ACP methyl ester carboxylesterase/class 3 adenylate cyclase/DNA-binding CsgD family transcriptional regulator